MARVKFIRVKPKKFFKKVQNKTGFSFQKLADICKAHGRSFSDWKYGECSMPFSVFRKLVKISGVNPPAIKILSDYWHIKEAARKGAFARNKIYGNPGTPEGRSKGGKTACRKFLANPKLAELVGIIIGDGGITNYQVRVTQNKETDKEYTRYVAGLFKDLFYLKSTVREEKEEKACEVIVSSRNLVEYLIKLGLKKGNKVKQQIDVPNWIKRDKKLKIACLRGLIDTDGSFYVDIHKIRNKYYFNPGIDFSTHSLPLFFSVKKILKELSYHPTGEKEHVRLRRESEIIRYFKEIESNNSKHTLKFKNFLRVYRK